MLDSAGRRVIQRVTLPLGSVLRRRGVRADQLTVAGLVLAGAAAILTGAGHLLAGAALIGAAGLCDLLDGPVAAACGSASNRGAFFDSVADRVSDALLLGGVAWYLAGTHGGAHVAAVLPLAVLAASMLVSYERAKAESLGLSGKGGLMERAERMILLAAGLVFSGTLVALLWVMLGSTLLTAGQRFVGVYRQASGAEPVPNRWQAARVESRWRTWREAAASRSGGQGGEGWRPRWTASSGRFRSRRSGHPIERWRARRESAGVGGQRRGAPPGRYARIRGIRRSTGE